MDLIFISLMRMDDVMLFVIFFIWISCHMHHGYIHHTWALPCKVLGGVHLNMCIGIWDHFELYMHIFRGSSSILLFFNSWILFFPCESKLVLSSITKKGEIESASRPLIDFGDSWQSQFGIWCFDAVVCRNKMKDLRRRRKGGPQFKYVWWWSSLMI
jgi:hypothetical protein